MSEEASPVSPVFSSPHGSSSSFSPPPAHTGSTLLSGSPIGSPMRVDSPILNDQTSSYMPATGSSRGLKFRGKKRAPVVDKSHLLEKIKAVDFHPKVEKDVQVRNSFGALVTIVGALIIFGLFVSETNHYLTAPPNENIEVDTTRGSDPVLVTFDITYFHIPCHGLAVDVVDGFGDQHQVDMGKRKKVALDQPTPPCGNCHGLERRKGECCNTCEKLKEKYIEHGIPSEIADVAAQCKSGNVITRSLDRRDNAGCRVQGSFSVPKVRGNFHVGAGSTLGGQGRKHSHVIPSMDYLRHFNSSHRVNHLSFGTDVLGGEQPLNGRLNIVEGVGLIKYYINVIPSEVENHGLTYQYSSTENTELLDLDGSVSKMTLPGIYFIYSFSPMIFKYHSSYTFSHYFTRVSSIVGGTFVVLGLCYRLFEMAASLLKSPFSPKRQLSGGPGALNAS